MVFGHVLMHIWIVLPDVALGAAVRNSPEAKRRGIRVWTLELQRGVQNRDGLLKKRKIKKDCMFSSSDECLLSRLWAFECPFFI